MFPLVLQIKCKHKTSSNRRHLWYVVEQNVLILNPLELDWSWKINSTVKVILDRFCHGVTVNSIWCPWTGNLACCHIEWVKATLLCSGPFSTSLLMFTNTLNLLLQPRRWITFWLQDCMENVSSRVHWRGAIHAPRLWYHTRHVCTH